jgi:hypothetical protein
MISGTVQFSGRVKYTPPATTLDSSSNPTWLSDVLEQLACSARKEDEYTLTIDGDTAISLSALPNGVNMSIIKVTPNIGLPPSPANPDGVPAQPNPVTVKLTSAAGSAQGIAIDGFMVLLSQSVPYTAMSIARPTGVQTTVRVQLFSLGS